MSKIFFDHQKFSTQKYGGISRYFANIIQSIDRLPESDYLLGVLLSGNHYLRAGGLLKSNFITDSFLSSSFGRKAYQINKLYCSYLLERNNFDIFHPTYYDPYFVRQLKKPLVITVHDMTHERLPEYFWSHDTLTFEKRLNIERADKIIAISETTKSDLIKYSDVDPAKIEVIYHGLDFEQPLKTSPVPDIPDDYLLFIGDRGGYKNFHLFIEAYLRILKDYPELKVVIAGGGKLGIAEEEFLRCFGLLNRVKHIHANDEQLNFIYQNALLFVYPSLHEGFGLPILEAFRNSCPLILSETDCFKEIAQDAAFYFDARDADSLAGLMDRLLSDQSTRGSLLEKGTARLEFFSLQKSVAATLNLYQSML